MIPNHAPFRSNPRTHPIRKAIAGGIQNSRFGFEVEGNKKAPPR